MSSPSPETTARLRLRTLLESACAAVRRRTAQQAAADSLVWVAGLWLLAVTALALSLNADLAAAAQGLQLTAGLLLIAAAATPIAAARLAAWQRVPTLLESAQRLDLATDRHNLITNAVALAGQPHRSDFAELAIAQGLEHAEQVQATCPRLRPVRWPTRALKLAGVSSVVLLGLAWLPIGGAPSNVAAPDGGSAQQNAALGPIAAEDDETRNAEQETETPAEEISRDRRAPADILAAVAPPESASGITRFNSRSSPAAGAGAPRGASPNAAGGAAGEMTAQADEATPASPPRGSSDAPPTAESQPASSADAASRAGIAAAASAAGRSVGIDAELPVRDFPQDGENDASPEAAEEAEESDAGQQQRGGSRLRLPDRRAAPSRDLGITGPDRGRPGTGRGGPSPTKKTRGTGTMVMGVPEPDFLRGQLNPGPSAVDFTTQPPVVAPAEHPAATINPTHTVAESQQQPFVVPWSESAIVLRYLQTLHQLDQAKSEAAADAANAPAETTADE